MLSQKAFKPKILRPNRVRRPEVVWTKAFRLKKIMPKTVTRRKSFESAIKKLKSYFNVSPKLNTENPRRSKSNKVLTINKGSRTSGQISSNLNDDGDSDEDSEWRIPYRTDSRILERFDSNIWTYPVSYSSYYNYSPLLYNRDGRWIDQFTRGKNATENLFI